mgnify:FL=1|jgi:rhomboid-like protein
MDRNDDSIAQARIISKEYSIIKYFLYHFSIFFIALYLIAASEQLCSRAASMPPKDPRTITHHPLFRGPLRALALQLQDMSNVVWAVWRAPCPGLRTSVLPVPFRAASRDLRITPWRMYSTSRQSMLPIPNLLSQLLAWPSRPTPTPISPQRFNPVSTPRRFKRTSAASQKPKPKSDPSEVHPRQKPFSDAEIKAIFGPAKFNAKLGNRILAVLHGHRLSGTLDADLPVDIARAVTKQQVDAALEWLRDEYPLDEDAAIFARIEREDRAAEEKLVRRAEKLGLYKPQSGSYDAELGEEGSPYGKSVLKEARERNEKRLLAEQERKRQEWLDGEKEEQERLKREFGKNTSLQEYQEAALTEGMYTRIPVWIIGIGVDIFSSSPCGSYRKAVSCLGSEASYCRY